MKQSVSIGQVDYTVLVFIPDPASTDGSGKTGLVAANLTVSGTRVETDNDVIVTNYTSSLNNLAALTTAHTDWGVLEVSSTIAPGLYRLDIADAIFATGAWTSVVYVMITSSAAAASPMEFVLNIAPGATGGLPVIGTGTNQFKSNASAEVSADVTKWLGTAAATPTVAGVPEVDLTHVAGATTNVSAIATNANAIKTKTDFLPSATAGAAGGLMIAGSNAATTLASLTVSGNTILTGTTTLTGHVLFSDGIAIAAPSTLNRSGFSATGNGSGNGIVGISGGSNGHGIYGKAVSGGAGGIVGEAVSGGSYGIAAYGQSAGLRIDSATIGIDITTSAGHGISIAATGSSKHGVIITGGNAGTSDGLKLVAGSGGIDFRSVVIQAIATQASVDTIDDFLDTEIAAILAVVDTEVGAIKTQTDKMVFTVANQLDANIQSVNDVAVLGDGAGTPWGP